MGAAAGRPILKTRAVFFPFNLFGVGAELLADAFAEMLADNRREKVPTRALAYQNDVHVQELALPDLADYQDWRRRARRAARQAWRKDEFLLWVSGNHLGVLPVYDELAGQADTLVVQLDAHLDVYNLTDCTTDLSHGNFLLHCAGPLPPVVNLGHRELLLRPEHVGAYYAATWSAAELAVDPAPALKQVRARCRRAARVFIDIDCDVFDPAFFPAVSQPLPFGLSPNQVLAWLDAIWSDRVIGVAVSEFDPGRDRDDRSLATLVWLLEYLLLKRHEPVAKPGQTAQAPSFRRPAAGT
jgi:agmatinase